MLNFIRNLLFNAPFIASIMQLTSALLITRRCGKIACLYGFNAISPHGVIPTWKSRKMIADRGERAAPFTFRPHIFARARADECKRLWSGMCNSMSRPGAVLTSPQIEAASAGRPAHLCVATIPMDDTHLQVQV
jgi:hypothetical protein